jgi:vitamin K-dependent gamma-carboxylase
MQEHSSKPVSLLPRFARRLFEPVDAGLLVFFRMAFGLLMAWEASRYLTSQTPAGSWIERLWIHPEVHLKYFGFEWVSPWPGDGMYYHFWALGILAVLIAAGCLYRVAAVLFFLGFTYIFLLDQATYLNHFYLISLVSFLMIFLPLNCAGSVDAWLWPSIRRITAPAWTLWLLRFQVGIAYTYGGIAKLNGDWLRGEPMRNWLAERSGEMPSELTVLFFSWGGAIFDLLIVPALLWPRTRIPAFLAALFFHFSNDQMFQIGVFPWFMVAGTLLFMPPDWVQLKPANDEKRPASPKRSPQEFSPSPEAFPPRQKIVLALLGLWVAFQTLVPFRHWLYPDNVSWTEEGHRFSWHMKLRSKVAFEFRLTALTESGNRLEWSLTSREIHDESTGRPFVDPRTGQTYTEDFLAFAAFDAEGNPLDLEDPAKEATTPKQLHGITTKPDMLLQYAHFLGGRLRETGHEPTGLYATVWASLNYRPPQLLIDPGRNLLDVERSLAHADWIMPLTTPLKPSWQPNPNDRVPTAHSGEE